MLRADPEACPCPDACPRGAASASIVAHLPLAVSGRGAIRFLSRSLTGGAAQELPEEELEVRPAPGGGGLFPPGEAGGPQHEALDHLRTEVPEDEPRHPHGVVPKG